MSIKEKVAQIQSMERELEETRAAAVKEAIAEVQTLINLFNITASDVPRCQASRQALRRPRHVRLRRQDLDRPRPHAQLDQGARGQWRQSQ